MRMFLISDNTDTRIGMRLTGADGVVVHEKEETIKALDEAFSNEDIGIVLITTKLVALCRDKVFDLKLNRKRPLIVEIPDRHATSEISETISRYINEAIGIKI